MLNLLYYQALTLYQKIPGTEYEQATSTYSLATTLLSQGKLDPTEALYQDALKQAVSAALFNDEYRYQLSSPPNDAPGSPTAPSLP